MEMTEMMKSMSMDAMPDGMSMDMMTMQECIEACNACSMAATMCAASDLGEEMARCAAMCMTMSEMADACMRMMMRPAAYDMEVMTAMLNAGMTMANACAAECRMHADMHDHCRYCAMACDEMVAKMEAVMASMSS